MADFALLKERVSLEQAAQQLGLTMRSTGAQLRGPCPACNSGGDRALVITPAKGLFYCFASGIGGDLVSFWGHIKKCSPADAGNQIAAAFGIGNKSSSAPVQECTVPTTSPSPDALKPLDYLVAAHPAVQAVGFDEQTAAALGIGFAPKGMMKGLVAVPLRLPDGTLVGYAGITEARLPSSFRIGGLVTLKTA